jgi:hypothetical protein
LVRGGVGKEKNESGRKKESQSEQVEESVVVQERGKKMNYDYFTKF